MEPPKGFTTCPYEVWLDGRAHILQYDDPEDAFKFRHTLAAMLKQLTRKQPKWLYHNWLNVRKTKFLVKVFDTQEERFKLSGRLSEPWD